MSKHKGFSLIELLIVVAIILIIAAIAIPSLLRSKMVANNTAAASTIRTVNTAQIAYSTGYPLAGFAGTWAQLGPGAAGCGAASACLLDQVVACSGGPGPCSKSGYNFFINDGFGGPGVGPLPGAGVPPNGNYTVSATPMLVGTTGDTNFCSYDTLVVQSSKNASPPLANDPAPLTAPGETVAGCATTTAYGSLQ